MAKRKPSKERAVLQMLNRIHAHVHRLTMQGAQLMAKFEDVKADLGATKSAVDELIREVGVLVAAGPGTVTQAQLDELDGLVKAIGESAKAADPNP